jgi:dihydroorotate dehydrogenase
LVKIAPDLSDQEVLDVAELVSKLHLDGVIATNTTTARDGLSSNHEIIERAGEGGLSGPPLKTRSLEVLRILRAHVPSDLCIISVGGVTSGDDVLERLSSGATLVQGYTGFIYEGPLWARAINKRLSQLGFRGS